MGPGLVLWLVQVQHDQTAVKEQLRQAVRATEPRWPGQQRGRVLADMSFPSEHGSRTYSTNPLKRLNREANRRADVVGIFPDADAVLRLAGSVLIEIHDEWQAERCYFSLDSMTKLQEPQSLLPVRTEPLRLAPIR